MKNPLEYSLLEVSALLQLNPGGPESAFSELMLWIKERQELEQQYRVQKQAEQVKARKAEVKPSARMLRNLNDELLDTAEIVTVEAPSKLSMVNITT